MVFVDGDPGHGTGQRRSTNLMQASWGGGCRVDLQYELRHALNKQWQLAGFTMPATFGCTAKKRSHRDLVLEILVELGLELDGIRQDLEFFILRLDAALRLHDPTQPEGARWIGTSKLRGALHLGLGLPF